MSSPFTIATTDWWTDQAALRQVRREVFIVEQGIPEYEEWDGADAVCQHVVALTPNRDAIGTGRLDPMGKIGRVAVLSAWRGKGVGGQILDHLIALAAARGLQKVYLHAQESALGFYRQHGFVAGGQPFSEADITHRRMELSLDRWRNEQRTTTGGNAHHPVDT